MTRPPHPSAYVSLRLLSQDDNRALARQLPWVAVSFAADTYMEFHSDVQGLDAKGLLSGPANVARARARLAATSAERLASGKLRRDAVAGLKRGRQPACGITADFANLAVRAAAKPTRPPQPGPAVSREFVNKQVATLATHPGPTAGGGAEFPLTTEALFDRIDRLMVADQSQAAQASPLSMPSRGTSQRVAIAKEPLSGGSTTTTTTNSAGVRLGGAVGVVG